MRSARFVVLAVVALVATTTPAYPQSTTGTIVGRVTDSQGLATPGVTVSVSSPALQGVRTASTSATGDYVVTLLPTGSYEVRFELSGFETQLKSASLAPGQVLPLVVEMGVAGVGETIEVRERAVDVLLQTTQSTTSMGQDFLSNLPTTRDVQGALLLSPSVHPTGPNGNYSIAGAMSFENLFLLNGATINDNLRGQPHDLYIEDAVLETTIAASGISAEFGRFGGGVVNVVTKSGGNVFGGSFRESLMNDRWRSRTPFERQQMALNPGQEDLRIDATVPTHEFTLGGPLLRDRLWFFTAGRQQSQKFGRTLVATNIPYTYEEQTGRFEGKLTFTPTTGHRISGDITRIASEQVNSTFQVNTSADLTSLYTMKRPMDLLNLSYSAVVTPVFFVETRASIRNETVQGMGSTRTDRIFGTLLIDPQRNLRFWAPTFCGVCGDEERDNSNLFVKGTYFLSSPSLGSHNMVFGYDWFSDRRLADNYQSGSNYRIQTSGTIVQGATIYPQFLPGSTLMAFQPILVSSRGNDFQTHSFFVNDNWRVTPWLTANVGVRFDRNRGENGVGNVISNDSAWSPRIGVVVDPAADGRWTVTGSVARYVAAIANTIGDASSPGGNANAYVFGYGGPAINADPNGPLVGTAEALEQVFEWFDSNGGADLPTLVPPVVRGVTPLIRDSLTSPNVIDYSGGISRTFGARGTLRADVTYRDYRDFYVLRTDRTTGQVTEPSGRSVDLTLIENTNDLERQYAGLALQGTFRVGRNLDGGANYTLSRTWGNVEGESVTGGPVASGALQYPEYKEEDWNYPVGDLSVDQRHRVRLWANYSVPRVTGLGLGILQVLESGVPYGALGLPGVDPRPYVTNPGYASAPGASQTAYYFTESDAFRTEGQARTDLAINYVRNIERLGSAQLFAQLQVMNVFNHFQLCGCGGTVAQSGGAVNRGTIDQTVRTTGLAPFNPFTTTPVEGTNWAYGQDFGKALNRFAYTSPRTIRLSFGVRF
ncbi:MAG: TonB-dependent receptor [Vicinamibacterales bacterium]